MIVRLVVEPLYQITGQGHIIIINHRHVRGVVALVGRLVVTIQIVVRVELVSVVANQFISRVNVRYRHLLVGQTRMVIGAHLVLALKQ